MQKTKHITIIFLMLCAFNAKAQHNVIMEALEGCPGDDQYLVHSGQSAVKICGQIWMRHNLGANYSLNPDQNPQVEGLHGNYYQFGIKVPVANTSTTTDVIPGYNLIPASNDSWNIGTEEVPVKTANDPCPNGFRLPTNQEWRTLIENTEVLYMGNDWQQDFTNFENATVFKSGNIQLTLPANGVRSEINGYLVRRARKSEYWSSTYTDDSSAYALYRGLADLPGYIFPISLPKIQGKSVKCIAE